MKHVCEKTVEEASNALEVCGTQLNENGLMRHELLLLSKLRCTWPKREILFHIRKIITLKSDHLL